MKRQGAKKRKKIRPVGQFYPTSDTTEFSDQNDFGQNFTSKAAMFLEAAEDLLNFPNLLHELTI